MKNLIAHISQRKAAMAVGIAFIASVFIITLIDSVILANFVVPGDTAALARDIKANRGLFSLAAVGYLLVLILDSIIGLALYVVLRPANEKLAFFTAVLRWLYVGTLMIGLLALLLHIVDVYAYASVKLLGYVFFALHLFVLGCSVFKSRYIAKSLGVLLMLASFTYVIFFVDLHFPETLQIIAMSIMLVAELSLSIWLVLNRNTLPEVFNLKINSTGG